VVEIVSEISSSEYAIDDTLSRLRNLADIAHRQFKDSGKPRIYTFFKNADIKTGDARQEDLKSLWAFQDKLSELGHFYTRYDNIEHLKRQFRDQLDKMLEEHD
jgi:internalin A